MSEISGMTIKNGKFMHISFDDVENCLSDITANASTYTSIFDNAFFAFLKSMHEQYGAVFSLYIYNLSKLSATTRKFAGEFRNNNSWLKLGLHSSAASSDYAIATSIHGKTDWDTAVSNLFEICGDFGSIDRIPRLHMFAGSKEALIGMRDTECGLLGALSADDNRDCYYLDENTREYLLTHSSYVDLETGLVIFGTNLRLDWFDNYAMYYTASTPYAELVNRYTTHNFTFTRGDKVGNNGSKEFIQSPDRMKSLIVFAHEWLDFKVLQSRVESAIQFAKDYGYEFDYPQNRIITSPWRQIFGLKTSKYFDRICKSMT